MPQINSGERRSLGDAAGRPAKSRVFSRQDCSAERCRKSLSL